MCTSIFSLFSSYASVAESTDLDVTGNWKGDKASISAFVKLEPGENTFNLPLEAMDVDLWWPAGYGEQIMYNMTATVDASRMTRALGFRSVRLQTDSGDAMPGQQWVCSGLVCPHE